MNFGFYNMDCIEGMKEFPDTFFDLAIVDPPYGSKVGRGGYMTNRSGGGVGRRRTYHLALWSQDRPSEEYFKELQRVSKNQIIWGGNYFADMLETSPCWIVWDKGVPEGVHYADCELAWTSFDSAVKMFNYRWSGMMQENMKEKEFRIHPTQKPIALYDWLLNKYAKPGDIILDTHVGSASSLIACERLNHKYVGFEIDETYYKMAKERLAAEVAQENIFSYMEKNNDSSNQ